MTTQDFTLVERVRELFSYDPETGVFVRIKSSGSGKVGRVAGTQTSMGYLTVNICGKNYSLHRLAWLYSYGNWPVNVIDHINGVKSDNRLVNLRDVPQAINSTNRLESSRKGYIGRFRGGWRAQVTRDGVRYSKVFATEIECRQWIADVLRVSKAEQNKHEVAQIVNLQTNLHRARKGYVGKFRDGWRAQVQRNKKRLSKTFATEQECHNWIQQINSSELV